MFSEDGQKQQNQKRGHVDVLAKVCEVFVKFVANSDISNHFQTQVYFALSLV